MRFFDVLDLQYLVLAIFLGLISVFVTYLAFGGYRFRRGTAEKEAAEEYPEGLRSGDNPIPPFLIFLYLAVLIWIIFYVFLFGLRGGPF
jgi:hypothetical protein